MGNLFNYIYAWFNQPKMEVVYKASRFTQILDSSEKTAAFFRKIWDKSLLRQQEQVYVIYVDDELKPIHWICLHTGGVSNTVLDVKVLIYHAINLNPSGVFIAHNHPRGGLKPTAIDIRMTHRVVEACKIFDIKFYDHIILTSKGYTSFDESGLLD